MRRNEMKKQALVLKVVGLVVIAVVVSARGDTNQTRVSTSGRDSSSGWAVATDSAGITINLKRGDFSEFWVDCGPYSLEVAPDSVVELTVTGQKVDGKGRTNWTVSARARDGFRADGTIDYGMTYASDGQWGKIVKSRTLKRLMVDENAALSKERPLSDVVCDVRISSGERFAVQRVSSPESFMVYTPPNFDWDKRTGSLLFMLHETTCFGMIGKFGVRSLATELVSASDAKLLATTQLPPWGGADSNRPSHVVSMGASKTLMWSRDAVVGLGPHGWTTIRFREPVVSVDFKGSLVGKSFSNDVPIFKSAAGYLPDDVQAKVAMRKKDLPPSRGAIVKDRTGARVEGTGVYDVRQEEVGYSLGAYMTTLAFHHEPSITLSPATGTKMKVPFSEIATIDVRAEAEQVIVDVKRSDGTTTSGTLDTGRRGTLYEHELQIITECGMARIAWEDVRRIEMR
jgi:hypothetical protein